LLESMAADVVAAMTESDATEDASADSEPDAASAVVAQRVPAQ
jgi:hypothetical protein